MANQQREILDSAISAEISGWVRKNWDADLTLGEWWRRLAEAHLAVPHWPEEWYGRGWTKGEAQSVFSTLRSLNVPGPPAGLGIMLAGPTLLQHGTDEQKQRFLPDIISGTSNWCQLFSEPGAGSDLAAISTRAVRGASTWTVNGQKVWTSNGHLADYGMLLARTGDIRERHQNLTWFAINMEQPGIEVRPLREMTGRSLFTEVFIDGASVYGDDIVGEVNGGWAVARTTLLNERVGLGGGGGAVGGVPGRRGGALENRAGNVLTAVRQSSGTALAMRGRAFTELLNLAQRNAVTDEQPVRDSLVTLYILERISQLTQQRAQEQGAHGPMAKAGGSVGKLLVTRSTRIARDLGMSILGAEGMLWAGDRSTTGVVQELCLFSPAVSIYGGTDQIQRNILAERVLNMPRA